MGVYTTKPVRKLSPEEFKYLHQGKQIEVADHAFFHLSTKQRKIFNEEDLINIIKRETPRKVYLQENGRFGAYYRKSDGYRKIIIEVHDKMIVLVSFMDVTELPRYGL